MKLAFKVFFIFFFASVFSNEVSNKQDTFVKYIHEEDYLFRLILKGSPSFQEAMNIYFMDGAYSSKKINEIIENLGIKKDPSTSIFEFASGYGMVTRHLVNDLAPMRIVACDIHPQAVSFIKDHIGVEAIGSHYTPENLHVNETFDVVFALSFFSHMPHKSFGRWLKVLYSAVKPGGYLIFTTHGRATAKTLNLHIPLNGILYAPGSEQMDLDRTEYGGSLVTPEYVSENVFAFLNNSIFFFTEAFWWSHQDLYIIKKP